MSRANLAPRALANLQKIEAAGRDGATQKEVLIAWDIENAKVPTGVPVEEVERAISNAFQYLQRRKRAVFCCALSRPSLTALENACGWNGVEYLLKQTKVILAAGGEKGGSTDVKLCEEIDTFVTRQTNEGKAASSVVVVLTGDDDFTKSIRNAMDAGMDVEVLHPEGQTSVNLLKTINGRANVWHHDWLEFLEYWLRTHHKCPKLPDRLEMPPVGAESGRRFGGGGGGGGGGNCRPASGQGGSNRPSSRPKQRPPPTPPQQQQPQEAANARAAPPSAAAQPAKQPAAAEFRAAPWGRPPNPAQAAGGGGGGGGEVVVASLHLERLSLVQGYSEPVLALSVVCNWLQQQRSEDSEWFQTLTAIVTKAGCKLAPFGQDLYEEGAIQVTCASPTDDPTDAIHKVRRVRDQVRSAIIECLLGVPDLVDRAAARGGGGGGGGYGEGPSRYASSVPSAAAGAALWPRKFCDFLRTAYPTALLESRQLQSFLADQRMDPTTASGAGGSDHHMLRLVNLVLLAEAEVGLPPSTVPGGEGGGGGGGGVSRVLVPVEKRHDQQQQQQPGLTAAAEKAAVQEFLMRRLSVSQLLAQLRARCVLADGNEKRDLAEALCGALQLWSVEIREMPSAAAAAPQCRAS